MKKSKYYLFFQIALLVIVISSISFYSCPPLKEEPADNITKITGVLTLNVWTDLLEKIYKNAVFVNLDLSECTAPASGGDILKRTNEDGSDWTQKYHKDGSLNVWDDYLQFNPSLGGNFGKEFILSIILPDVATMINNASGDIRIENIENAFNNESDRYAFKHFTNLKSITGKKISLVGTFAFSNCTVLEEAIFPNLVIAMQYAFYNCKALKTAEYEKLRHIMPSAFENCTSLEKAEYHNADIITQRAFKGCTNLKEVNFSNVRIVEPEAFRNCTSLRTARFLVNIWPRISSGIPVNPAAKTWSEDTIAFHNNVFRGCTSLELLDVRNAWNVYFGEGSLANIGTHLELHLYDDIGERSWGHPQIGMLLGEVQETELKGGLSLKTLNIVATYVNTLASSRILHADYKASVSSIANPLPTTHETSSIRNWINSTYNGTDRDLSNNEPINPVVKVTVSRRPALL